MAAEDPREGWRPARPYILLGAAGAAAVWCLVLWLVG